MKKIVLFLALAVLFVACKEDGDGRLDPDAKISIRAAKGKTTNATRNPDHLSPLEIVKQTMQIIFINKVTDPTSDKLARGFADTQRDFANERLLMWGTDVIHGPGSLEGLLSDNFIAGENMVLVRHVPIADPYPGLTLDTIAYIPNAVLRQGRIVIHEAFNKGDYAKVYKLFDQTFRFTPITGPEWRALRDKGLN